MSVAALREVRLYGHLGREFGRVFRLAVSTPAEAVQALHAVLPGFGRAFVGRGGQQAYHVFVGRGGSRRDIGKEDATAPLGATEPIRFVPVVAGAKRGGALQTIVGAVLVVVGVLIEFYSYGADGGVGAGIAKLGYYMMISGVVQMLSPQRAGREVAQSTPSYGFDGALNSTEQGGPVPLVMGRVICGSTVVSQGLSSDDIAVGTLPELEPVPLPGYEPPEPGE